MDVDKELRENMIKLYENKKAGKVDCVNPEWEVNKRIQELMDIKYPREMFVG